MNKEQLHYFTLAYQTRNYSAAAKRVPMSPQGFAKSIHSLENELGVPLFSDENGALTPTAYAEELLKFANNWEVNYHTMKGAFTRIQAMEKHEIRLGTSLGIIGFMGTEFLSQFHREHPDISVNYNESHDSYCEEGLRRGIYDLAFTLSPYESDFITTELYGTQTLLWVNTRNELSEQDSILPHDLAGQYIALPGEDFKIYRSILNACKDSGVEPGELITSAEIFWLYELASRNRSLSFTLPHLVSLSVFSQNENVIALPLEGMKWRFGISYLSSHSLTDYERVFIEHCEMYSASLR